MSPYQNSNVEDQFSTNFDLGFSGINNLHPICPIRIKDFNGKNSKLCVSEKNNTASIELGNLTND